MYWQQIETTRETLLTTHHYVNVLSLVNDIYTLFLIQKFPAFAIDLLFTRPMKYTENITQQNLTITVKINPQFEFELCVKCVALLDM
jgi:hypothetical protein